MGYLDDVSRVIVEHYGFSKFVSGCESNSGGLEQGLVVGLVFYDFRTDSCPFIYFPAGFKN
jgi:hypothetical protein